MVGSSVNFTWSFSGDVDSVKWGIKQPGASILSTEIANINQAGLVSLASLPAYTGRVSASRSGDSSSGQAMFTLSFIKKDDERSYGCQITPNHPDDSADIDFVYFAVEGR